MINVRSSIAEMAPYRAKQYVEAVPRKPATDAAYWAAQMACVAAHGDRVSFMRIYDHFAPRLQRYLNALGVGDGIADDLVQEALLKLWHKADQLDATRASLATWLFRVARNLYIDHVRREPNWIPVQEGIDRLDRDESARRHPQPESWVDEEALRQTIAGLPVMEAKLIRMSYLERKSHREIANELDKPLGSVKTMLRRSFAKLQHSMRSPR